MPQLGKVVLLVDGVRVRGQLLLGKVEDGLSELLVVFREPENFVVDGEVGQRPGRRLRDGSKLADVADVANDPADRPQAEHGHDLICRNLASYEKEWLESGSRQPNCSVTP